MQDRNKGIAHYRKYAEDYWSKGNVAIDMEKFHRGLERIEKSISNRDNEVNFADIIFGCDFEQFHRSMNIIWNYEFPVSGRTIFIGDFCKGPGLMMHSFREYNKNCYDEEYAHEIKQLENQIAILDQKKEQKIKERERAFREEVERLMIASKNNAYLFETRLEGDIKSKFVSLVEKHLGYMYKDGVIILKNLTYERITEELEKLKRLLKLQSN